MTPTIETLRPLEAIGVWLRDYGVYFVPALVATPLFYARLALDGTDPVVSLAVCGGIATAGMFLAAILRDRTRAQARRIAREHGLRWLLTAQVHKKEGRALGLQHRNGLRGYATNVHLMLRTHDDGEGVCLFVVTHGTRADSVLPHDPELQMSVGRLVANRRGVPRRCFLQVGDQSVILRAAFGPSLNAVPD